MQEGRSPDPRFTLANERTFLAWVRTSLALVAGGLGIETFARHAIPAWLRVTVASLLMAIGAALALGSFFRWRGAEAALRRGEDLTITALAPFVSGGVAVVAVALLVAVLVQR